MSEERIRDALLGQGYDTESAQMTIDAFKRVAREGYVKLTDEALAALRQAKAQGATGAIVHPAAFEIDEQ